MPLNVHNSHCVEANLPSDSRNVTTFLEPWDFVSSYQMLGHWPLPSAMQIHPPEIPEISFIFFYMCLVLKCDAREGRRRSVGPIVWEMKKY